MEICSICELNHPTNLHYSPEYAPVQIKPMPNPTRHKVDTLIEYWHISKAHSNDRYERMQYTVRWFCKKYAVKPAIAYKWLDRQLET